MHICFKSMDWVGIINSLGNFSIQIRKEETFDGYKKSELIRAEWRHSPEINGEKDLRRRQLETHEAIPAEPILVSCRI